MDFPEMPQIGEDPKPEPFLGEYATKEEAEKALADLKAERERLAAEAAEAQRLRLERDALMARPEPQPYTPPKPELEFPDPVSDPEGHKKAMREFQRRIEQDMENQRAELSRKEQERQAKEFADGLWNEFRGRYGDEGLDDEDIVNAVASRELQSIRSAGGDPQKYIQQNRDAFLERVASGVRGKISRYRERPANRTGGVAGGSSAPAARPEQKVPSFMEQLREARTQAEKVFG